MTRERARSMDQRSFWVVNPAGAPGKLCRPPMTSSQPGGMLKFAQFLEVIWGMSANLFREVGHRCPIALRCPRHISPTSAEEDLGRAIAGIEIQRSRERIRAVIPCLSPITLESQCECRHALVEVRKRLAGMKFEYFVNPDRCFDP
jgi:hypothetical protein